MASRHRWVAAAALAFSACWIAPILRGQTAVEVAPDVVAVQVDEPPTIDGLLIDPAWATVARAHRGVMAGWTENRTGRLVPQQRIGYVCYDERNLYVAMQAFTPEVLKLKAGGEHPWGDDCLEIHIRSPKGHYAQIVVSADARIGSSIMATGALLADVRARVDYGPNYWSTEVLIPWKTLKMQPEKGAVLGFNLAGNRAHQGGDDWSVVTWGESFWLKENGTTLQLR